MLAVCALDPPEELAGRPAHVPIEGSAGLTGAEPQTWETAMTNDIIFVVVGCP